MITGLNFWSEFDIWYEFPGIGFGLDAIDSPDWAWDTCWGNENFDVLFCFN